MPDAISAAHPTLPIPSYVEVTAIDSGRTILVRINDRGPMRIDRIIALSPGAADQLGVANDPAAPVRVRKVNPPDQERAILRNGARAAERLGSPPGLREALRASLGPKLPGTANSSASIVMTADVPPSHLLKSVSSADGVGTNDLVSLSRDGATLDATPTAEAPPSMIAEDSSHGLVIPGAPYTPPPPSPPVKKLHANVAPLSQSATPSTDVSTPAAAAEGRYAVQLAALSSREKAEALADKVGGFVTATGSLFRIRTGNYVNRQAATAALANIHAKGYAEARMVVNTGR